jgi:hypothetical protein
MAYTVAKVYGEVCKVLLEDAGLTMAYTQSGFLSDLTMAVRELLQRTGICKDMVTVAVGSGQAVVAVPDEYMEVMDVYWNGKYLHKSTGFDLDESDDRRGLLERVPIKWREDKLAKNTIELIPTPESAGSVLAYCTVQPATSGLLAGDTIPLVPDSMAAYLKYFVLRKIFSSDGEAKDRSRAEYCRARIDEIVNLGQAIMSEDVLDERG